MTRTACWLGLLAGLVFLLAGLLLEGAARRDRLRSVQGPAGARLSTVLGLTDLAIWTEARYTRHPSQADLFTAFQDAPGAFDHFPAGAIVAPPPHLADPR